MGRSPCCDKLDLKKGPWTPEEDQKLLAYIEEHGHGNWRALPANAGLQRCGKSCRLRWTNYLRPDIKRGKFSLQEEQTIIQLHALLGNRWSAIATHLPKRTDNEIKNYWNTHLKKRLTKMGIDPVTHKPKNDALLLTCDGAQQNKNAATLSHMAQWESARLEAEARLARQSNLRSGSGPFSSDNHTNNSSNISTSTMSRCLDIVRVWPSVWPSTSVTATEGIAPCGIGLSSTTVELGVDSPTSTLSFSKNGATVHVVGATAGGAVEFMSHSSNSSQVDLEDGLVKEDRDQEHKKGFAHGHNDHCIDYASPKQNNYHNRHDHHVTMMLGNSLSFSALSGLHVGVMKTSDNNEDGGHDHDEVDNNGHDNQSFMEGFTELLLAAATTTSDTSDEKSHAEDEQGGAETDNTNNEVNNNGSGASDCYEDNKNYWNSILHLVNSSPSQSLMF